MALLSVNGELKDSKDLDFPIHDAAYLYGSGCFETILIHHRQIHLLTEHVSRLQDAASFLQIPYTLNLESINSSIHALLSHHPLPHAIANLYLSAGDRTDTFSTFTSPQLIITLRPFEPKINEVECTLQTELTPRNHYSAFKLMSYLPSILEQKRAETYTPILLSSDQLVLETPTASILAIKDHCIFTVDHPHILPSVTLPFCIDLLSKEGLSYCNAPLDVSELHYMNEICLINATGPIRVSSIHEIPHLKSDKIISKLIKKWTHYLYERA